MKNYYEILGIRQNFSSEEIRRAFRKKAKKVHPDLYQLRVEESEMLSQSILKLRKLTISGLIKRILPKSLVNFIKDILSKI